MSRSASDENGWDIAGALGALQARMDPYIWDQGQELYRRDSVEDFAVMKDGTIQVKVLDPRDARRFFVSVRNAPGGRVEAKCVCPYRLEGFCRHQVVALQYLARVACPSAADEEEVETDAGWPQQVATAATQTPEGSVLYRFLGDGSPVATTADGSLLRVSLLHLGTSEQPSQVALQLFTGTGWTEVRTPDLERWIRRGVLGPHPRDAILAHSLIRDGAVLRDIDVEALASLLVVLKGSPVLVDRGGRVLPVGVRPWLLEARLVRGSVSASDGGAAAGLGIEFACRSPEDQRIAFEDVAIVPSVAPWIQLADGSFHPLEAGAPGCWLEELQLEDHSSLRGDDLDRFLTDGVQRLERLCAGAFEMEPELIQEVEGVTRARVRLGGNLTRLAGRLELAYGEEWTLAPESPEPWTLERDGEILRFPPAGQALARAGHELERLGFSREGEDWVLAGSGILKSILARGREVFVCLILPERLETFDLVEREPRLLLDVSLAGGGQQAPPSAATGEGRGSPTAAGSGMAWFEVRCNLRDGEREVPLSLTALRDASLAGEDLCELEDGTVLRLGHPAVKALLDVANETAATLVGDQNEYPDDSSAVRMPLYLAGELATPREGCVVEFHGEARQRIREIGQEGPPEIPLRAEVADLLRSYQAVAVGWFDRLAAWGLGGILADEMGLGKTLMTLSHFFGHTDDSQGEREEATGAARAPILVVCPTSLSFNWLAECGRFFPRVACTNLCGQSPAERHDLIVAGADLLITSYSLLRRDREHLESRKLRAVVLDEAQHIKNAESQTAKAAFAIEAEERWALTGTPIENHLRELWSLFHFTTPGFLGTAKEFEDRYGAPVARGEKGARERLRTRVNPFVLRRTKDQVLADLPPCIEQVERVPMTPQQEVLYQSYLNRARGELVSADPSRTRFQILQALTRLRQICCHPALVLSGKDGGDSADRVDGLQGGKFDLLQELIEECVEEDHRVLLFSQFTSMLDLIEVALDEKGITHSRLDGNTRDRQAAVRRFTENPAVSIFLISLKAGGFGLNLTQADTVILYDPWWNPAVEQQAAARAHRIGQTVPVHVHKLITAGSVEEKILELQQRKKELANLVVESEEDAYASLSGDELRSLLFDL